MMMRPKFALLGLCTVLMLAVACGQATPEELQPAALIEKGADALSQVTDTGKYLVAASQQIATVSQSQGNLEQLLGTPELGNVRWTGSVRAQLAVVNLACDTLQGLEPPEQVASVHRLLMQACGECRTAVDQVLDGIDGLDANALNQALATGQRCALGFRNSRGLLDQVAEDLDLSSPSSEGPGQTPLAPPTVNAGANLRQGPGTNFPRVGGLREGTVVAVVGRNQAGDWLAIEEEGSGRAWIAAFLVDNAPRATDLPIVP